jgi:hypothetical protein
MKLLRQYIYVFFELGSLFLLITIWYISNNVLNTQYSQGVLIDAVLLITFIVMIVQKNPHSRFFYYFFGFLTISAVVSLFERQSILSLFSTLAFIYLILGVVNVLLFNRNQITSE